MDSAAPRPAFDQSLVNLKWIAVILMTACHILLTRPGYRGIGLFVGATVFPTFAGMIVIHLANNPERRFPRYLASLMGAAIAAELPYLLLNRDDLSWPWQVPLNALATFACGVLLCAAYHRGCVLLLCLALVPVITLGHIGLDGTYMAPLAMLMAFIGARRWRWGLLPSVVIVSLGLAINDVQDFASISMRWHCVGLGMLPFVYALSKISLAPPRGPRLFFYAYYPGHLLLIWLLLGSWPTDQLDPNWLSRLSGDAVRDHPGEKPATAFHEEALAQSHDMLAAVSGEVKSRVAAEQFMGFYLINMRSRTDYCRRQGVEISSWSRDFARLNAQDYAKSRMILAREPDGADAAERKMFQQLSPNFAKVVDVAMSDLADQLHVSTKIVCQAFAHNGAQIAASMELAKTNPALNQALAEAR